MNTKRALQLFAEALREIGVLFLVFAPLDAAMSREHSEVGGVAAIVMAALLFLGLGITIEAEE